MVDFETRTQEFVDMLGWNIRRLQAMRDEADRLDYDEEDNDSGEDVNKYDG